MIISADNLGSTVFADISKIVADEKNNANRIIEDLANESCQRVIETSPVKDTPYTGKNKKRKVGSYKKGWIVKTELKYGEKRFIVTNKKEPELTHLIENGSVERATKRGKNRGKMPKLSHIRRSFDETVAKFENKYLK